jgi:predicted nucleic acid-binding protein
VKIYLNVSCLNRPFDDQEQSRIRWEAAAIGMIFEHFDSGEWMHISSEIAIQEIEANTDVRRQRRVRLLLPEPLQIVILTPATIARGKALEALGLKAADALHVAAAEAGKVDVLLSCDDRFCRTAQRHAAKLLVPVRNPLDWLKETEHGADLR